jgi:hypothetical protein
MFFTLSALLIISNNDLALYEKENYEIFLDSYVGWLNKLFTNSQKITGEAIKLDWLPE